MIGGFRGVWLACSGGIKAPPFFPKDSSIPVRAFSARWTGQAEPRFTEECRVGMMLARDPVDKDRYPGTKARL